ncbi:hypothetical protein [Veillonella sp.]
MATRSTIKDWFVNHSEPLKVAVHKFDHAFSMDASDCVAPCDVEESFRTLDDTSVLSLPVTTVQWHSVSQNALTWSMLVNVGCHKVR